MADWKIRTLISGAILVAIASCSQPQAEGPRAYASLERSNEVVEIDPGSGEILRRIIVGTRPRGIAVSKDGSRLFVAVSGSPIGGPGVDRKTLPPSDRTKDGVVEVDLATGKVVRRLEVGPNPEAFALSPDESTLFVSNEDSGTISAIPLEGPGGPRQVFVGDEPEGVAVSGDGTKVFVACEASDEVVVLDAASMTIVHRTPIAGRPRTLLTSKDGESIFVTIENAGGVATLSARSGRLLTRSDVSGGNASVRPMGLAQASGADLFVTTGRGSSVLRLDALTLAVTATIAEVGQRPWGIAAAPSGRLITANGPSDDLSIVDGATGQILSRVKVGGSPWGVVVAIPRTAD